jgi:predicted dinucleotide-utilizing enzyme
MRVGLIGLGAIGQGLLRLVAAHPEDGIQVVGAIVRDPSLERPLGSPPVVGSAEQLLALDPEVVVEMGGHTALAARP